MHTARQLTFHRVLIFLVAICLGACAVSPEVVETSPGEASRAQLAEANGNFSEAGALWQDAAQTSVGSQSNDYRLRAAEAWWQAGEKGSSELQLAQVEEYQLVAASLARFGLLHAELALADGVAGKAEHYLEIARQNLTADQQSRYRKLQERTDRLQTDPASYALSTAASVLRSQHEYDTTQGVAILQLLEDVPSGALMTLAAEQASAFGLEGWPQLTVLIRNSLINGDDLNDAATYWSSGHPDHDVSESGFIMLAERYRQLFSLPSNIAVLLPMKGGLAAAGKAIRDGLISAFLDHSENVSLRFYPTNEDPQSAVSSYFQAMAEGAQWIIGPLRRESVFALSELGSLGVPVLALNNAGGTESPEIQNQLLFNLSLSQEDEARAVARQVLENGREKAIMLIANSPWGQRMEVAFGEEFISGGGSIMASAQFESTENDHSALITSLLKIDESKDRKNRVQATLGIPLNFEPSRRDDFELFFIAATPVQGRQIRPQLRFHEAGDKEVYAMSRIFDGANDLTADRDLNGIYFPSTHWQLSRPTGSGDSDFASLRGGDFAPLHALGNDAWNLLPWLPLMRKDPDLYYNGAIGSLHMTPDGQLLREPAWAQFSGGRPVEVEWDIQEN